MNSVGWRLKVFVLLNSGFPQGAYPDRDLAQKAADYLFPDSPEIEIVEKWIESNSLYE